MNLGPEWIACLAGSGYETVHWSSIGPDDADDAEIMGWARENGHLVLTADLDFGARLVRRRESGPSVVQLRTEDTIVHGNRANERRPRRRCTRNDRERAIPRSATFTLRESVRAL